jgi:hypothetical protein
LRHFKEALIDSPRRHFAVQEGERRKGLKRHPQASNNKSAFHLK